MGFRGTTLIGPIKDPLIKVRETVLLTKNKKAFHPKGRKACACRVTTQVDLVLIQIRSLLKVRELLFRYPLPVNVGSLRLGLHIPSGEFNLQLRRELQLIIL
jgi:hypothetical protein